MIKSMKLQYEVDGEGEYVVWQSVAPGEMLYENEIVLLKL